MRVLFRLLLVALAFAAPAAFAHDYAQGSLHIIHPWSRETPKGANVGGGYLTIENRGSTADRFIGFSSGIAGRFEIHEMAVTDGVMRMRPLPKGVEIAPGMTATFAPGGLHLMFMDLKKPLVKGERFKATLRFERAGEIEVEFVIDAMGAGGHNQGH